ncbi:MAG: hypothetical protein ACOYNC_01455 [Bacteroidales bacterium]
MRNIYRILVLLLLVLVIPEIHTCCQVSINIDGSAPDPSAGLDVNFTNKGFLPPRVSLTAIDEPMPVETPAIGLLVYNTDVAGTEPNNVLPGYYCWNGFKWLSVSAPQGTYTGDMQYWNGIQWISLSAGSQGQVLTVTNGVPVWKNQPFHCGMSVTISHVEGVVAPVSKTVTYGTISNVPGANLKCWITSNLGSDRQATAVNDATEASAGWYWQFNLMQGYKHDGITVTPAWTITSISENSDWIAANDPCTIELGNDWRIPTATEWSNVNASGSWTNWNGPWNSGLKMHAAGYIRYDDAALYYQGTYGYYWSSTQNNLLNGLPVYFASITSSMGNNKKAYGYPLRCLRDF